VTATVQAAPGFFETAVRRQVVLNAVRVSLIVGSALALINHGDSLLSGSISSTQTIKILLTYMVPYGVATYSAVRAIQSSEQNTATKQVKSTWKTN